MTDDTQPALCTRYSDAPDVDAESSALVQSMIARGSCRAFQDRAVPQSVIDLLCATALSAPSKSDLQQRDIIVLRDPGVRARLADLVAGQEWVARAPMIAVFCGNNRRQRLVHDWQGVAFANDHLDAFFNATGDAAIAMGAFVTAAEAIGLGCCPISAVRNDAAAVSDLLHLPPYVFPFAGLAFGYPKDAPMISKRLPLALTCHTDRYDETDVQSHIAAYDADRAATQPYDSQRLKDRFGHSDTYTWSTDKTRQYSQPERDTFGAYIRAQGFKLD